MPEKKRRKRERKDGRIQLELELPKGPDGKRRRKYFYGATKAEAMEKRDLYVMEYGYDFAPSTDMTVEQWAQRWLRDYKASVKSSTRQWYANALANHILPNIGSRFVSDIMPMDIQTIYNKLDGKSFTIVNSVKTTLAQMFEAAVDNNMTQRNPASRIKPPKGAKGKREAITSDQIKLISSNWAGHRVGLWAMLMLFAGLRRGEMAALYWDDISFKTGVLSVARALEWDDNIPEYSSTKTDAGVRSIPMPPILVDALQSINHREGLICKSANGQILTLSAYRRGWESFAHYLYTLLDDNKRAEYESAGLVKEVNNGRGASSCGLKVIAITAHQLRHTFATMCYEAGIDVKTCSKWMGHTDIETTLKIYTHLSDEQEARATTKWNTYWEQWKN